MKVSVFVCSTQALGDDEVHQDTSYEGFRKGIPFTSINAILCRGQNLIL